MLVPKVPPLPAPVRRARRDIPAGENFSMELETVTPILGGAPVTRQVDTVDIIRVPTIRGHLRFWWRALYGAGFATPTELFAAETALWGMAADEKGGRSAVEITLAARHPTNTSDRNPSLGVPSGYALWPARGADGVPAAPRRDAGQRFSITVRAPQRELEIVRNSVRAWILFGGYGSRSRRGMGSLTVVGGDEEQADWLPLLDRPETPTGRSQLRQGLNAAFGTDIFQSPSPRVTSSFPLLAGSIMVIGTFAHSGTDAWARAIGWLKDFRQKEGFARDKGTAHGRPGRSRWPEADKLRRIFGTHSKTHSPRYDAAPVWPRARFGLPILGQFSDASGPGDPPPFELTWRNDRGVLQDRVASPLIVKALPVGGGYYPCALWLARGYPRGEIVVVRQGQRAVGPKNGSAVSFDAALSESDRQVAQSIGAPWHGSPGIRNPFLAAVIDGKLDPNGRRGLRVA
jgi:CRISPR-associated protein Cmr1